MNEGARRHLSSSLALALACVGVAVASLAHATACNDAPTAVLCKDVPDGGCPLSHGVACDDPACAAVYACFDGKWSLDHVCAPREAGADDARGDASDAGAPPPRDASFDVPPGASGGPGCADLQPPDCALGTVLACPSNSCCGCEDLFFCADAGWSAWGSCDGGAITAR